MKIFQIYIRSIIFLLLWKKSDDLYNGKKKSDYKYLKKAFKFPTERYLNIVKRGYKDCND
jgi:hypothetical protein